MTRSDHLKGHGNVPRRWKEVTGDEKPSFWAFLRLKAAKYVFRIIPYGLPSVRHAHHSERQSEQLNERVDGHALQRYIVTEQLAGSECSGECRCAGDKQQNCLNFECPTSSPGVAYQPAALLQKLQVLSNLGLNGTIESNSWLLGWDTHEVADRVWECPAIYYS
jgi:hypothetical protein